MRTTLVARMQSGAGTPPQGCTPCTVLRWATLGEWLDAARTIKRRYASALRNRQLYVRALPVSPIYQCSGRATLRSCDRLLRRGPFVFASRRVDSSKTLPHQPDRRDCHRIAHIGLLVLLPANDRKTSATAAKDAELEASSLRT